MLDCKLDVIYHMETSQSITVDRVHFSGLADWISQEDGSIATLIEELMKLIIDYTLEICWISVGIIETCF